MGKCTNYNSSLISLHLLLFVLFTINIIPSSNSTNLTKDSFFGDFLCNLKPCGQAEQGTCQPTDVIPFYDCACKPGWKKIQLGPVSSCLLPNCTIDFGCGNGVPPDPQPPPTQGACAYRWCGDGSCVENNGSAVCQCNPGSSNLFNMPAFACFQQCSLGSDCTGVHLGSQSSPSPPPPSTNGSNGNGSAGTLANSSALRNLCASVLTLLAATFLTWI